MRLYPGSTIETMMLDHQGAEGKPCRNCHARPATVRWLGEGGSVAFAHGLYQWWCERCAVEAQLEHARKQATRVAELEARLAALSETP